MKIIKDLITDEERALYATFDAEIVNCEFSGVADGESALKECKNVKVDSCKFLLRYPLWHCKNFEMTNCTLAETCRAPLWYDEKGSLTGCTIDGVKTLRECNDVKIDKCKVNSTEFGWKCSNLCITDTEMNSEYFLLLAKNVAMSNCRFGGKYSFQYVENATIENCVLDTKDAFWHSKNVTVKNCVVKGEYLAWYSDGLTLIDCKIEGTQPLCYCKNLTLINCTMTGCDLSFEYSEVNADVKGKIDSVKNPKSGKICADEIGEIVLENAVMEDTCKIFVAGKEIK